MYEIKRILQGEKMKNLKFLGFFRKSCHTKFTSLRVKKLKCNFIFHTKSI